MPQAFKTSDLAPDERVALERLLGRTLRNDGAFELIVHGQDQQETAPLAKAAARIRELAKGKSIGGATVREPIDDGRRS
jgi:hypothetical protein